MTHASSGGGVGDPLDREVELVRKDFAEEYVSAQRARDLYGVIIENDEVDLTRTQELRRELREQRRHFKVVETASDEFDQRGCRICPMSSNVAAKIGVMDGDMVEYISDTTAPLRAWVKVGDDLPEEGVLLGPVGRRILKLTPGDEVWVRRLEVKAVAPA